MIKTTGGRYSITPQDLRHPRELFSLLEKGILKNSIANTCVRQHETKTKKSRNSTNSVVVQN